MKRTIIAFKPALTLLALLLASSVLAQSGNPLAWWNTNGGAARSAGGSFILSGTAGQPDAGIASGGGYVLLGGYWNPVGPSEFPPVPVHLPIIIRNDAPIPPPLCGDQEPNGIPEQANPITLGPTGACIGALDSPGDDGDDWFAIPLTAGKTINLALNNLPAGASYTVALVRRFGPTDFRPVSLPYTVPQTETYYILVRLLQAVPAADTYTLQVDGR